MYDMLCHVKLICREWWVGEIVLDSAGGLVRGRRRGHEVSAEEGRLDFR